MSPLKKVWPGVIFPTYEIGNDPIVIRDFAQAVEEMGFSFLLTYEHVLGTRYPSGNNNYTYNHSFHEPMTLFAYLASVTKHLRLITGILILPLRQTALVAKQAAEISNFSNGRFELGVGIGSNIQEFKGLGQSHSNRGEKIERQVDLIRKLWAQDLVTGELGNEQFIDVGINPRPQHSIPMWMGGWAEQVLERTARIADGWMPMRHPDKIEKLIDSFLQKPISFKAGELIARTSGTSQAENWNIYLYDKATNNKFVNQERYQVNETGQRLTTASCPFDYYTDESMTASFLALMGAPAPGQTSDCGNASKDVKGTLSGMWHLSKNGTEITYDGKYATPFSIYKNSAAQIILFEIAHERFIIEPNNSTHKDPTKITTSHCYLLTRWGSQNPVGYAFFRVDSDTQMSLAYDTAGSCPTEFPEGLAKKYYR